MKGNKNKQTQTPVDLWGPGERHRPLGPLVVKRWDLLSSKQRSKAEYVWL